MIFQSKITFQDITTDPSAWAACFLRFTLLFVSTSDPLGDDSSEFTTLKRLTRTGGRVQDWITEHWERKWYHHRAARVGELLFGAIDDCVMAIRRVFHGFSVAQDEDDGVSGMQARSLSVFHLCHKLQQELGQHVSANLYWTPPGQQGFDLHIDDHCVFAIQLKGRKRWVLHEPQEYLPLLYDNTVKHLADKPPRIQAEIILEAGDVLYVPRGIAHQADTKAIAEESIHLTIGVEIDAVNTTGRILHEIKRSSFTLSGRVKRSGLMAWHLRDQLRFLELVASFDGSEVDDELLSEVTNVQTKLKKEREQFLTRRSLRALAMATLYEVVHNLQTNEQTTEVSNRVRKKQRK